MSVIDLEGGIQPMVRENVALTYSGEVYNFRELRRELEGTGHRFTTKSDTEVVLRAYIEWGAACIDRFNGMFGFAIWDERSQELLLVRDRVGVKPVYYYPTPHGVLFGSSSGMKTAQLVADPAPHSTPIPSRIAMPINRNHPCGPLH